MQFQRTYTLDELDQMVTILKDLLTRCPIMTFSGELGAGKTTLIRALLKRCGVIDVITSPSFSILQQYHTLEGVQVNHFDLYRLTDSREFQEAGFDELLGGPESITLIEWPERIAPLLTSAVCNVVLEHASADSRLLTINPPM